MEITEFLKAYNIPHWAESERLEWKESSKNLKEIVKTLAAFSNTSGGVVICGISDKGEVIGQEVTDSTLKSVTQAVLAHTDERLSISAERFVLDNKQVLLLSLNESPLKPHLAYGRAYKRIGSSNVELSQAEYRSILAEKQNGHGADRDLLANLQLADLNTEAIYKFIDIANTKRNSNFSTLSNPLDILTNLELAHNGVLTKGAALLFATNLNKFIPQAEFRLAFFEDEKREVFLDQEILTGDIISQFDGALAFIKNHILIGADTNKIGQRTHSEFPMNALQEMLANALVHRDYHDKASSYCNIVKHKYIEVNNPGTFPTPRVTAENMNQHHASIPRNRRLARAFYLLGLIEQWGQGGRKIARACKEHDLKDPVWNEENGTISVKIAKNNSGCV